MWIGLLFVPLVSKKTCSRKLGYKPVLYPPLLLEVFFMLHLFVVAL